MKNLLVDIGNSSIKTAIGSVEKILKIKRENYSKEYFSKRINNILTYKKSEFENIGISCLNSNNKKIAEKIIINKYSVKPFFVSFDKNLPIKIKYEKSLGVDRICSAIAATLKYKNIKNILVIDFGTATTYNLISNRIFLGGLITPGIMTSLHSLNKKANLLLPKINSNFDLITNKTSKNILSGVIHQSLFTTENIINILKKKYDGLFVIVTGGFAELVFKKSCLIDRIEKNLVLEGINFIINYRIKK